MRWRCAACSAGSQFSASSSWKALWNHGEGWRAVQDEQPLARPRSGASAAQQRLWAAAPLLENLQDRSLAIFKARRNTIAR